jgi:TusA-related sulfurtransferase
MREDGEILLLADDPVALVDVPVLARANGWALDVQEHADHTEYHLRQAEDSDGR